MRPAAKAAFAFAREQERWEEPIDEVDEPSGGSVQLGGQHRHPHLCHHLPRWSPLQRQRRRGKMQSPSFKRQVKKKKDFAAALGIKKKPALA